LEFGGNTTSIKITKDDGRIAIIDAGSGIRNLGKDLIKEGFNQKDLFVVFTHFHWDHIQGFPFFDLAYNPNLDINIVALGQQREINNLEGIFKGQMKAEYFPVPLERMGAKFNFMQMSQNELEINNTSIKVIKQNHPGGSFGYRIEDKGKVLVICTDIEHGDFVNTEIVEFCKNADLLIHDAQYTSEELDSHKGWGHSSYEQAIEVAEKAGVNKLALTHHDPDHNDNFLLDIERVCQKRFSNSTLAREYMEIIL
jgi:phosphoribosyl 1,2-cyclic phosphodiesterase